MTTWRDSPGITMPLIGAAAGAIYGTSKEGEKHPLLFAALGAGAGVFFGVVMGSMTPPSHHVGRRFPGFQGTSS
jgi:hypothetical protein